MKAAERKAAKDAGERFYFTGKPCKAGHVARRYTSGFLCEQCSVEKIAREKATKRAYDAVRAGTNKDAVNARVVQWQALNPEKVRANKRRWEQRNPQALIARAHRYKARKKKGEGSYHPSDITALLRIQRGECVGCHADIRGRFHIDHIIPLAKKGSNFCGNLQLLCPHCNRRKSDLLPIVWRYRMKARFAKLTHD